MNQRNFLAGVASSGWTALIGLLVVPWYIKYLGIEAYGIIGVYLTMQNIFVLLDMGLTPAVSRDVARSLASGAMHHARVLVHSMSILFVLSGGMMALALAGLSPWIAGTWLKTGGLPVEEATVSLALAALAIGAKWPATLYVGVLNGARRVDLASVVTIATTTLANVGAVVILAFVEQSLRAFFLWQILIGVTHSLAMWWATRRAIVMEPGIRFDWGAIRSIWRFSVGMAAVAATGILFSQIDKVVLMRTATLEQVGYYAIATALAGILYRLITPAFNVVYPQFSMLVETASPEVLSTQYHLSTRIFLGVIFPVAMFLIIYARPILSIWINDRSVVDSGAVLVALLSTGTAIHCAMYFPYALQIAKGMVKIPLYINIMLSFAFIPAVSLLSSSMGATGAAIAWVILHCAYFALGTYMTNRYVLPGEGWRWILHGVAPPLAISVLFGFGAAATVSIAGTNVLQLLIGVVFASGALVTSAVMLPETRMAMKRFANGITTK
ncbi:MAG: oligosaccharide flippase family protein [Sphingomonadales bacterium]